MTVGSSLRKHSLATSVYTRYLACSIRTYQCGDPTAPFVITSIMQHAIGHVPHSTPVQLGPIATSHEPQVMSLSAHRADAPSAMNAQEIAIPASGNP